MLKRWLASGYTPFIAEQLGRTPIALPGAAAAEIGRFDWAALERMLVGRRPQDVLVVRRGEALPPSVSVPCSLNELRGLFQLGAGLVARRAERADEGLAYVIARSWSQPSG